MIKDKIILRNDKVSICIQLNEHIMVIRGKDLTDGNNEPTFFTRNTRGLKKGWQELSNQFNETMTMWDCMRILDKFKLNCHSYCAMD